MRDIRHYNLDAILAVGYRVRSDRGTQFRKWATEKLPKGKVLHHIKSVARKGKTTKKNTRVISTGKHRKIYKNRNKRGKI